MGYSMNEYTDMHLGPSLLNDFSISLSAPHPPTHFLSLHVLLYHCNCRLRSLHRLHCAFIGFANLRPTRPPASAGLASLPTGCVHEDSGVMNMNRQRSLHGRFLGHDLQEEAVRR
jgi:hypothetical protein